ncbi:MAG: AAA family ATPase [Leptospiraceae bacterium]|nr:AAA family ATPase [Leptospiraceae bacterium]
MIETDCYYIDKSLLIQELLDSGSKVSLITRQRRFGKILNLSMLIIFFEAYSREQTCSSTTERQFDIRKILNTFKGKHWGLPLHQRLTKTFCKGNPPVVAQKSLHRTDVTENIRLFQHLRTFFPTPTESEMIAPSKRSGLLKMFSAPILWNSTS